MAEASIITFNTGFSILKTAHSESFSSKSLKARLFILQVNDKIADVLQKKERYS